MAQRPPPDKGTVTVDALVSGTTADRRVRVRLEDGSERQLPACENMSELVRPGQRVVLYYGPGGELLGWYLPEDEVGYDLRS